MKKEGWEMKNIKTETIVRTIVLLFALINQGLVMAGKSPLPFTEEGVGTAFTYLLTVAAALWSWWKNNSFTRSAIAADETLMTLKKAADNEHNREKI